MTQSTSCPLILKRASASRLSGEWSDDDYDVLRRWCRGMVWCLILFLYSRMIWPARWRVGCCHLLASKCTSGGSDGFLT